MRSLILTTVTRFLVVLMLAFSVYLLLRGHNQPGGGFVGGLVAAIAFALMAITDGSRRVARLVRVDPRVVAMVGVGVALTAGLFAAAAGAPFLTGLWAFPAGLPLGTPLLFDVGVYLAVIGAVLTLLLALEDNAEGG